MEAISETPESEINFKSFVKFSLLLLRLIYFDFDLKKETLRLKDKFVYCARTIGFIFCLFCYGLSICSHVAYFFANSHKFNNTISLANALASFLIGCKLVINIMRSKDLLQIFEDLTEIGANQDFDDRNHTVKRYLDGYHRIMKFYALSFITVSIPSVLKIIPYLVNGSISMTVNYWYPFDPYCIEYYPLAWLWINWIAYIVLVGLLGADSLLYGLITVVVMEFDILKTDLMNMAAVKPFETNSKIKQLIDRHKRLLNISNRLQDIYSLTFSFVFVISSSILCFAIFQMTMHSDISAFWFYISYIGVMGGQGLLLCFFGQKLINSSESIAKGVYDCCWEDSSDVVYKKSLILIMIRSQKVTRLTAMEFADISLESFTSVSYRKFTKPCVGIGNNSSCLTRF